MISSSRLKRAEAAVVELYRDPRAEALALANDLVATLVAMDLLHMELGHEWPTDPQQLLDHVATLWREHANALGVTNDGSAERRIFALCRHTLTGGTTPAASGGRVARPGRARHARAEGAQSGRA